MVIIKKEKYILRRWKPEDAESLAKYINNKKIWDNCRDGLPYPYTLQDANAFIAHVTSNSFNSEYCIEVNGEAVGNIGFIIGTDVERFSAEIGYWIAEQFWNKGYMTNALEHAIDHFFSTTNVIRIYAKVYVSNEASICLLKKVGFTMKCIFSKAAFKNGQFTDMFYFEKIKE